jgi:hypothetical protein
MAPDTKITTVPYVSEINEAFAAYFYPTINEPHPAGMFTSAPQGSVAGDFNGDGHQDILISWAIFPHTVERQSFQPVTVFLNDGAGNLLPANSNIVSAFQKTQLLYRPVVADFNGDGVDDFAQAGMGLIKRNADGTYLTDWDPIQLVLSQPGGKMVDASATIEGQAQGGQPPGYTFGHDMSAGDIDGDGDADFYSGRVLFLNDGKGNFKTATDKLPAQAKRQDTYVMSSAIGDLDGDRVDDLVVSYAEGAPSYAFLSRWQNGVAGWETRELPVGLYGLANTKVNFAAIADINHDGLGDIVLAETRAEPYYLGRSLQILINDGKGNFRDETAARINNAVRDQGQGEGELTILDIDHDGDLDLFESTDKRFIAANQELVTTGIGINDGTGHFTWMPLETLPFVKQHQIAGNESKKQFFDDDPVPRLFPVQLDGPNGVDYVSYVNVPLNRWPQVEPSVAILYLVKSQKPYGRGVDETLGGLKSDDTIYGLDGNDRITGSQGRDRLDGGEGLDVAVFAGRREEYTVSKAAALGALGHVVEDRMAARDGRDEISTIERLAFSDGTLAVDVAGTAGQVYRLYQAAFARTPDNAGLKHNIGLVDGGLTLAQMSSAFLASAEFQQKYGASPSDSAYINALYRNVLGRDADPGGLAGWQGRLDDGLWSRTTLLIGFSESPENIANVGKVIDNGIWLA